MLHERTIDDYWNIDGDKSLCEPWIGVTRFELLSTDSPEGHMWVQGRLTKRPVAARSAHIWPEDWSHLSKGSQHKAKQKMG